MTEVDVDTKELTNFDRLARALPETGIARALLEAWREGDASGRVARLVSVAQPSNTKTEPDNVAPED